MRELTCCTRLFCRVADFDLGIHLANIAQMIHFCQASENAGAGKAREDYSEHMGNLLNSTRPEPVCLTIEVRPNDIDATFETDLCCALSHCGKTVDIDSHGPTTVQHVSCPEHGFLTSFPHRTALGEFIRSSANKILAINGHTLIEEEAEFIIGSEQPVRRRAQALENLLMHQPRRLESSGCIAGRVVIVIGQLGIRYAKHVCAGIECDAVPFEW